MVYHDEDRDNPITERIRATTSRWRLERRDPESAPHPADDDEQED